MSRHWHATHVHASNEHGGGSVKRKILAWACIGVVQGSTQARLPHALMLECLGGRVGSQSTRNKQTETLLTELAPPPFPHPSSSLFWGSKPKKQTLTVAILVQGTSWAVAVTQAFLTWVRFPLGPCSWAPWGVWFPQMPEVSVCWIRAFFSLLIFVSFSWKNRQYQKVKILF